MRTEDTANARIG